MATTAAELLVRIDADTRGLRRGLDEVDRGTGRAGKALGILKGAALGAGVALVGGFGAAVKVGFGSLMEHEKALAQTNAVLKSTGGVAGVTADHILGMADSLEKLTGVDDVAIQSGQNLLLTFTNIRNGVGESNQVFDEATKAALDMSVAMGQDMKSSAIQVGKALNDPIKGITALTRVGVTFTDAQKDQIKALVESGKTMEAQKIILAELTREFGGSAEAAGKTLPGRLNILKARLEEVAEKVAGKLLPVFESLVSWVERHWPQIERVMADTFKAVRAVIDSVLVPAFRVAFDLVGKVVEVFARHTEIVKPFAIAIGAAAVAIGAYNTVVKAAEIATKAWAVAQGILNVVMRANPIMAAVTAIVAIGTALVIAYEKSETFRNVVNGAFEAVRDVVEKVAGVITKVIGGLVDDAMRLWDRFGDDIKDHFGKVWAFVKKTFQGFVDQVRDMFRLFASVFKGDWSGAWDAIKSMTSRALDQVKGIFTAAFGTIQTVATALGKRAWEGIKAGLSPVIEFVSGVLGDIRDAIVGFADRAWNAAKSFGSRIKSGVVDGVTGVVNSVRDFIADIPGAVLGFASAAWSAAKSLGGKIVDGLGDALSSLGAKMVGWIKAPVNAIIGAWNSIGIPSFKIHIPLPGPVPDIDFSTPGVSLPDIPLLGDGGIVNKPTLAMIGERGPEAVVPLGRGGGGIGDTYVANVTVLGNVQTERDLVTAVVQGMRAHSRRSGALFSATPGVAA